MKFFLTNLALFIVFAVVFSSWSACGGPAANPGDGTNTVANANTAAGPKDPSTYPPLATGVATAEMEFVDGTKGTIADRKGKVVLINLWGIWCGPCRAEMPHLIELQEKYRDQGFQVIGLNVGDDDGQPETLENIKAFGEKTRLNYDLARGPREFQTQIYRLANFDAVPMSLLIDRDGHLRAVLRGGGPVAINQIKVSVARTMGDSPAGSDTTTPAIPPVQPESVPVKPAGETQPTSEKPKGK